MKLEAGPKLIVYMIFILTSWLRSVYITCLRKEVNVLTSAIILQTK